MFRVRGFRDLRVCWFLGLELFRVWFWGFRLLGGLEFLGFRVFRVIGF